MSYTVLRNTVQKKEIEIWHVFWLFVFAGYTLKESCMWPPSFSYGSSEKYNLVMQQDNRVVYIKEDFTKTFFKK